MYRYLLFYYDHYYPSGGMEDCILKSNNYAEIEQTVKEKFDGDYFLGTIAYYDIAEDEYYMADMMWYEDGEGCPVLKFEGWKEYKDE